MKISTAILDPNAPSNMLRAAEARTQRALARGIHGIRRVRVSLRDLNGPRGGEDAACRITVDLPRGETVVVEERSSSRTGAFRQALRRVRYAALRRTKRRREARRRGAPRRR